MQRRDDADRTRTASPLVIAGDAVVIDTTAMPIAEVVDRVILAVTQRG
jgi:cytidylate kinase